MFPFVPIVARVFISNMYWILSNSFVHLVTDHVVFVFFFDVIYHIDLHILNHPCDPGINPTWVLCDLFYVVFGSQYLMENFCIFIHKRYWPINFYFDSLFFWFWYQGDGGFIECLWDVPSSSVLWKSLRRICLNSLYVWYNPMEVIWSWNFVCREFFFFFL